MPRRQSQCLVAIILFSSSHCKGARFMKPKLLHRILVQIDSKKCLIFCLFEEGGTKDPIRF